MLYYHDIPPIFNEKSRVLILGTFPSVKSRERAFYYSHGQNRFWPLMARLLGEEVPGSEEEKTAALAALKSASGFIRREISARLNLRITPEFTFVLDRSVDYGIRINDLISKINKGDL